MGILRISQKGYGSRHACFYLGKGAYFGVLIAFDHASQIFGYLFC